LLLTVASLHADGIESNAVTNGAYGGISGGGKFVGTVPVVTPSSVVAVLVGGFP
jgi:hypothetical protein